MGVGGFAWLGVEGLLGSCVDSLCRVERNVLRRSMFVCNARGSFLCAVRYTEGTNALNLREVLATTVRDDVEADGDRRRTMRLGLLILPLGRRATSARRKL